MEKGFKGSIPIGGHFIPISMAGERLLWKNAQKNDTKNRISDTINSIKPIFNPFTTTKLWNPWYVDSLITSLTQDIKNTVDMIKPMIINDK